MSCIIVNLVHFPTRSRCKGCYEVVGGTGKENTNHNCILYADNNDTLSAGQHTLNTMYGVSKLLLCPLTHHQVQLTKIKKDRIQFGQAPKDKSLQKPWKNVTQKA